MMIMSRLIQADQATSQVRKEIDQSDLVAVNLKEVRELFLSLSHLYKKSDVITWINIARRTSLSTESSIYLNLLKQFKLYANFL